MRLQLKSLWMELDLPFLLFPFIAAFLGKGRMALTLIGSLAAHEAAHLIMARAAGVSVRSIRLTPFGGLARIENPYGLSAPRLIAVAAAGPLANLILLLTAAALCQWRVLAPATALLILQTNLTLMLFNLLPALPLDGGRILYALLSLRLPRARAARWCVRSGRVLAVLLVILAAWGFVRRHTLNLSPLFAALFILISARDEERALADSRVESLLSRLRPLTEPCPTALVAIDADAAAETALRALRPGRITLFALYRDGRLFRIVDERALVEKMTTGDKE